MRLLLLFSKLWSPADGDDDDEKSSSYRVVVFTIVGCVELSSTFGCPYALSWLWFKSFVDTISDFSSFFRSLLDFCGANALYWLIGKAISIILKYSYTLGFCSFRYTDTFSELHRKHMLRLFLFRFCTLAWSKRKLNEFKDIFCLTFHMGIYRRLHLPSIGIDMEYHLNYHIL